MALALLFPAPPADPSKPWTYDYVKRELERVPLHIPCAVLVGFRDYAAQRRAITLQQVRRGAGHGQGKP